MAVRTTEATARLRLQRLAKGALLVGIAAVYVLLLSLTLVTFGWQPALLAVFLVATGQCFRHIANEADRIGLTLASEGGPKPSDSTGARTRDYQRRMLAFFAALTQLPNAALAVQAFVLAGPPWSATVTGALLAIEALYLAVRRLNRRTAYGQASYGFRDLGPLSGGPAEFATARDLRAAEVERKLEELHGQVQAGRVSERAYKKACDRYRVRAVMARDRG